MRRLYIFTLIIHLVCRVHHVKCPARWITSWNQDCLEKYQQPQVAAGTTLMTESEEELNRLLMRVKENGEKSGLKLNIKKLRSWLLSHHFMAHRRGKVEALTSFIFLGNKITVNGNCSHEIKRHLLLGREAMTNLKRIDITLPKTPYHQRFSFSSSQRIDTFELRFQRRHLRVLFTARRSNSQF